MRARYNKFLMPFSMPVVALLAFSFPEYAYPDNSGGLSGYSGLGTAKKRSAYSNLGKRSAPARNQAAPRRAAPVTRKSNYAAPKNKSRKYSVNSAPRKQLADTSPPVPANKRYSAKQNTSSLAHTISPVKRNQLATINQKQNYIDKKVIRKAAPVTVKKNTAAPVQHKKHFVHTSNKHKKFDQHHAHKKHHGHSFSSIYLSLGGHYYPRYYYPYSYYSGYYDYNYPFYGPYGYTSDYDYDYYEKPVYSQSKDYMGSPGWDLLAQGNYQDAINVFQKDIQLSKDDGIPRVGLSLATAARGNLTEATRYMRDAFRFDPDSTQYLYYDSEIITIINELIEKYEYQFRSSNNIDDIFMVSALHYLKFDYDNAHDALNNASLLGDKGPSIGNLHRLIDDQLAARYADTNK